MYRFAFLLVCAAMLSLAPASRAVVTTNLPATVSGGSGAVTDLHYDDAVYYTAGKSSTIDIGGFSSIGGAISSVVLHVEFTVDAGYDGAGAILVDGTSTSIVPLDGDTDRTASIDITAGSFGIDTWPEVAALSVTFYNGDSGGPSAVNFDYAYLVITHEPPLFPPQVDTETPTNALPVSGGTSWDLVFSDEFNAISLDTSKWGVDVSTKSRAARTDRGIDDWWWVAENVSLDGSNLVLDVVKQDFNTMYCGSVSSDGLYEPKYGYLEARVQIADSTKDTHTAFWLQGHEMLTGQVTGDAHNGAEVDVFESAWFGEYTKAVVHIDGYSVDRKASTKQYSTPGLHSGYHVFGLEWTADFMNIYYDGVLKVTYTGTWVPRTNEWLWLSNGASFGDIGTFSSEPDGWLTAAKFDYVRVWEAAPNATPAFTNDPITRAAATAEVAYSNSIVGAATDGDDDPITYAKDSGPAWLTVASDGTLSGTPVSGVDEGPNSWTVRATDPNGAFDTATLNIEVIPAPYIDVSTASVTVYEGTTNTFDVKLRALPDNTVTVNVSRASGDADLTVFSGGQLFFTPVNGTNWQTVTLAAGEDADTTNGSATFICVDPSGRYISATVNVQEADNDNAPFVDNYTGATNRQETSTTLQGLLQTGVIAQAWICWGDNDAGTTSTGDWDNVVFIGSVEDDVPFSTTATGLATNTTYFYRCFATNVMGSAWSLDAQAFSGEPVGVGSGTLWTPASVASLAWYDPSDASAVSPASGTVTQLDDISGAGNHMTPLGDPQTGVRQINGLNVIDFDGNEDLLQKWSFSVPASGDIAIFMVAAIDVIDSAYDSIFSMDAANDFQFDANSSVQFDGRINATISAATATGGPFPGPGIYNSNFDKTGTGVFNAFIDGTKVCGDTGYATQLDASQTLRLFSNRAANSPVDGCVGEVVIVEDVTEETRQKLDGYLAHKWGLEANLPGGHPYRSTAPGGAVVVNALPSGITISGAQFNATLDATGTNYHVYVYHGTSDGGSNATGWASSAYVGAWTNIAASVSYAATLGAGQTSYYTFMASNDTTTAWASPSWTLTTPGAEATVAAPTGLGATPVSTSQVNLSWTDNSTNETGFLVERSTTSGSGFATIGNAEVNAQSYSDMTVSPGLTYYYQVTATNTSDRSAASAQAAATVPKMPATVTFSNTNQVYTGAPRTVGTSTTPGGLTVDVTYSGNSVAPTNAGSYAVTGTVNEVSYQGWTNGTLVVSKATPTVTTWPTASAIQEGQTLASSTLSAGSASVDGAYAFSNPDAQPPLGTNTGVVVIFSPTDNVNYNSLTGSVTVVVAAAVPDVPTGLIATPSVGQVALSWSSVSNSTGYNVKYSTTQGGAYTTVGAPTTTNYTHTGLANGGTYYYVVSAVNEGVESADSAEVSAALDHVLPFAEDFEGLNTGGLAGQNMWVASNAVVQTDVMLDAKAGSITSGVGFARQDFAGAETNVWTDMEIQPVFCADHMTPPFADATASVYFNTNGNPVAFDGTNRVTYTGTVVTNGSWVRLTMHHDYAARTWDLYINSEQIGTNLGFYSESVSDYETLDIRGGASDVMAFDDIRVSALSPFGETFWLSVSSLYGDPSPSGNTPQISNALVNAWISDTSVTNGLAKYDCTGWLGTGSAPASGTNTSMSFTITNDTTITWQWQTNYWVTLEVVGE